MSQELHAEMPFCFSPNSGICQIFATVEEEYVLKGVFGMRPSEGTQMRKRLGLSEAVHLVGDSL